MLVSWIVAPETSRTVSEKEILISLPPLTLTAAAPGLRPVTVGRRVSGVGLGVGLLGVGLGVGAAVGLGVGLGVGADVGADPLSPPSATGSGLKTVPDGAADAGSGRAACVAPGRADWPNNGAPDRTALPRGTATPSTTPTCRMIANPRNVHHLRRTRRTIRA
jgi:hypothetical protein